MTYSPSKDNIDDPYSSSSVCQESATLTRITPVRYLWDRLCVISERLLMAKAALEKLNQMQSENPDDHKASLIAALSNEITLLTVVKHQIEESVSKCFSSELSNQLPLLPSISNTKKPIQLEINEKELSNILNRNSSEVSKVVTDIGNVQLDSTESTTHNSK